jgi:hypothetical protein
MKAAKKQRKYHFWYIENKLRHETEFKVATKRFILGMTRKEGDTYELIVRDVEPPTCTRNMYYVVKKEHAANPRAEDFELLSDRFKCQKHAKEHLIKTYGENWAGNYAVIMVYVVKYSP